MSYKVILHPEVDKDISKLSKTQLELVFKQLKKLSTSPELGKPLGNKNGYNLRGYRKMYADKKKIRIVYKIVDEKIIVEVIAIGKRKEMEVYKKAFERISE
jgi:mRNA interferase RelE/StbE